MFGKSYEAKNILQKKAKRPFAKELVEEVVSGEDLFSALFSENIKEVKRKVREREQKTSKKGNKASKKPDVSVVEEDLEPLNSTDLDQNPRRQLARKKKPKFFKNTGCSDWLGDGRLEESFVRRLFEDLNEKTPPFPRKKRDCLVQNSLGACSRKNVSEENSRENSSDSEENSSKFDSFEELNFSKSQKDLPCSTPFPCIDFMRKEFECSPILPVFKNFHSLHEKSNGKIVEENSKQSIKSALEDDLAEISHFNNLYISSNVGKNVNGSKCDEVDDQNVSQRGRSSVCKFSKDSLKSDDRKVDHKQKYPPDPFEDTVRDCENLISCEHTVCSDKTNPICSLIKSFDPFASSVDLNSNTSYCHKSGVEHENSRLIEKNHDANIVSKSTPKFSSLFQSKVTHRKKKLHLQFQCLEESASNDSLERKCFLTECDVSLQTSISSRYTLRKSHLVVPLQSWDTGRTLSTGFREAHIAFAIGTAGRNESITTDLNLSESYVVEQPLSFKDLVLQRCGQTHILDFSEEYPNSCLSECQKVGEGVYGEVFSRQLSDGRNAVLKIIPIEGSYNINGEVQKKFEEILSEIVITMELSNLRRGEDSCTSNFPELIACRCVQGSYPSRLVELWEEYSEEKTSENDSPSILPKDQIFLILELANVGKTLEGYTFNSAGQAFSAFMQVTYTLAVAERTLQFEHRDLHWGNILIQPTREKKFSCKLAGQDHNIRNYGIQANIIDFTLSRMTYEGCCIYNNLADDPAIFEGNGDYQFDIYRLMRDHTNNCWQIFEPYTNVLWLSYVLDKLVTEVYYRNKTTKIHKQGMQKLQELRGKILQFKSVSELALSI